MRVLIAELPGMLRDIIRKLLVAEEDVEVVGEVVGRADLLKAMSEARPDVVILGLDDDEFPESTDGLFAEHPLVRVLGVAGDGRSVYLYELRPQKIQLGEISPEELVRVIREAVRMRSGA